MHDCRLRKGHTFSEIGPFMSWTRFLVLVKAHEPHLRKGACQDGEIGEPRPQSGGKGSGKKHLPSPAIRSYTAVYGR